MCCSIFKMYVDKCSHSFLQYRPRVKKINQRCASVNLQHMSSYKSGIVFLYSSLVLLAEQQRASLPFERICCGTKRHFAAVLFTRVQNRPTLRVSSFATRVFKRGVGLCTVLSTCVANQPTVRAGQFATRVLKHKAVLCYCTVHLYGKSTDTARQSIRSMCAHARGEVMYCTVHSCQFAQRVMVRRERDTCVRWRTRTHARTNIPTRDGNCVIQ